MGVKRVNNVIRAIEGDIGLIALIEDLLARNGLFQALHQHFLSCPLH